MKTMEAIERVVAQAIFEEIERQGPPGATVALQGGTLWIDGEAEIDIGALVRACIVAYQFAVAEFGR